MIKIIPDHEGWLTQWDKNRTVLVSGLDLTEYPDAVVQFSSPNDGVDKAYPVKPYVGDDGLVHAKFPNIFLTFPGRVDVCVYRDDHTCSFGVLVVMPHEKPDDYIYEETEVLDWRTLDDKIGDLSKLSTTVKSSIVDAINEVAAKSGSVSIIDANDIPKVFIDGTIPTSKTEVLAKLTYVSKSEKFDAYIKIKCQGTSSMNYPKKNFTVKLYSDEARETKLKKVFRDWKVASEKFVLKANYIDHSHARNIVSANLWAEIVSSRTDYESLPAEMRNSPRNGAVDGFPMKLYTNGTYQGVYTWNISKDDWMWGMNKDNANHVLLCGETNTDGTYAENACNFRALWNGVDGTDWSVEVGTNSDALKNSLNALISCVKTATDAEFKSQIGTYLDVQSAIDYYLFQYVICGLDGLAKNMLLATYDMTKWYCGAYDLDSVFGLWWNGSRFVSATYRCPEDYQERFSLLWERVEALYVDELKARYEVLRSGALSFSNMVTLFERFMDTIGSDLYAEDLKIYSGIPSASGNNITQIRDYIRDRLTYVDSEINALTVRVACTGITLSSDTLAFTSAGTQTLTATVAPENCTDTVVWSVDNSSIATVSDGVVTAKANGSCVVTATCGEQSATCSVTVSGISSGGSGALPSGYSAVDYVESPGGAYIDTAYVPTANTGTEYKIYVGAETAGTFGNTVLRASGTVFLQITHQSKFVVGRRGNEAPLRDATFDTLYTASMFVNDDSYTVNGVQYDDVTVGATADTQSLRIGASQAGLSAGAHKIYYIRLYESGELVRNYVPCTNPDGIAGLYETVEGQFLSSATGTAYTAPSQV